MRFAIIAIVTLAGLAAADSQIYTFDETTDIIYVSCTLVSWPTLILTVTIVCLPILRWATELLRPM
jgi:hypothetical protein